MLLGLTVSMTFIGVSADGRIENYLAFSEQVCDTTEISHGINRRENSANECNEAMTEMVKCMDHLGNIKLI